MEVKQYEEMIAVIASGKPFWVQVFEVSSIYMKYNKNMHPDVAYFNAASYVRAPVLFEEK